MTELQRLYAPNSSAKAAIVRRMEEVIELTADFMASYPTIGNTPNLEVEPQSKETLWLGPPLKAADTLPQFPGRGHQLVPRPAQNPGQRLSGTEGTPRLSTSS